jgi:glyoxylase-like metal-dependent hydrolase (beta-lactamase superfamily II)
MSFRGPVHKDGKTAKSIRRSSLALALIVAAAAPVRAEDPTPYAIINKAAAEQPVVAHALRGGVTELEGSGGNIGVFAGASGLLMVDAGIAVSREKIEAALRRIRPGKVHTVIDTHWHWDHTDGNGWVHDAGATIIATPQTAAHLAQTIRVAEWGHTFTPVDAGARPTELMTAPEKSLNLDGETVRIRAYLDSHTDGDLSVYFEKADVLFTGDTWWNGLYPFIDYVEGGGIDGMIKAADANIAMAGDKTIVVPGHGPAGDRNQLIEYRDMLAAIRDRVAALKQAGNSLEQVIAARPTAPFDAKWGQAIISPALFTTLVYRGV